MRMCVFACVCAHVCVCVCVCGFVLVLMYTASCDKCTAFGTWYLASKNVLINLTVRVHI